MVQVLLFLLVTMLGIATGNLNNSPGALPWGLEFVRRQSLPLAGVIVLLIIGVMAWQHRAEQRSAVPARPVWDSDRSPFPGLEAFTEQDSAVFFGRDSEITELLERLHPVVPGQANRLIAVVGPSGAGKSSLVQAGVVPRLRQRRGGWIVVPPVVPGDHPLRSLARSLAAARSGPIEDLPDPRFADELRAAHSHPSAPVLVIVDQTEELITLAGPAERDTFLDLLAGALDADPRLWIVMILRSEFLTTFLGTKHARLFREPVIVGTLGHAALVEVIEQPARRAGLTFDPPTLPQRMATDAGSGDALPLLAYALQELCLTAGPGGVLTGDAYQRIGGVTGVLTRQADKVTTELGGLDGPILPTLLRFVTIGETEPTRRRVSRGTLTEAQWRIAEAFIAARLLTSHTHNDDAILEVAHEALFRHWAPLQQAIEASTEQLRWRADLERWARDWDNSGRQDAYLLRDERLETVQRWTTSDGEVVANLGLVAEFLDRSNRADRATMEHLSETIARQALGVVDHDPDHSLLLALAAYEECAPTTLAIRALTAALVASRVRIVLRGHDGWVRGVAWEPKGSRLATVSDDCTARIWDADSGSELLVLRGHNDVVRRVAWAPGGKRLATGSDDCTTRIWNTANGHELTVLHGHDNAIWGVAWSPDCRRLATTSRDCTTRIWNPDNGHELTVLHGHDNAIWGVAWSPDGRRLATVSRDCTTRIWDTTNGHELAVLRGHGYEVRGVAWSPDGIRIATASSDRTARIWDADSGGELVTLGGHNGGLRGVAWSSGGERLASASNDGTARIWDSETGYQLVTLRGHKGTVAGVAWSPDDQLIATASHDWTTRIWDTSGSIELAALYGHGRGVHAVAWSPEGRRLATGSGDQTARIWDGDGGSELLVLRGHEDSVLSVAWSSDGKRLATGSADHTARIWNVDSNTVRAVLHGHDDEVRGVTWSPNGERLATASRDQTVRIWDADTGSELAILRGHDDWVRSVKWSPDGHRLATASGDRTARIWDADTGSELSTLHGHDGWVRDVAWSPDGQRLVNVSNDRTVRTWDAGSAAEIVVIGVHGHGVESVSWSSDGKRIASASQDGIVRVWDATITIEDLVAKAHRRTFQELSAEERRNLLLPAIDY